MAAACAKLDAFVKTRSCLLDTFDAILDSCFNSNNHSAIRETFDSLYPSLLFQFG